MNYEDFMKKIFDLRKHALTNMRVRGKAVGFTDKSDIEKVFLSNYESIIGDSNPTVTEYGSGVPILSLYLAHHGKISKLVAIDSDPVVLHELEHIVKSTKLPVEILKEDLKKLKNFPDTDIGISINTLYGYAPDWITGADQSITILPVINRNILNETKHSSFGIFRFIDKSNCWPEKAIAEKDMENNYSNVSSVSIEHIEGGRRGFRHYKNGFLETTPSDVTWVYAGAVIGKNRKS